MRDLTPEFVETRAKTYAKKFGLTREEAEELVRSMPEQCPLCERDKPPDKMVLDHNHRSGEIRGFLCRFCNGRLLGPIERQRKDAREWLQRAAEYLQRYEN